MASAMHWTSSWVEAPLSRFIVEPYDIARLEQRGVQDGDERCEGLGREDLLFPLLPSCHNLQRYVEGSSNDRVAPQLGVEDEPAQSRRCHFLWLV